VPNLNKKRRKIRVLHVIDSWNLGGAQTVLLNLLEQADSSRFSIKAYSLHGPGKLEARAGELCDGAGSFARSKLDPRMVLSFLAFVRKWKPHIVHAHLVMSCALVEHLRRLLPKRVRIISHMHSLYRPPQRADKYQNFLEASLYRNCDAVVACSKTVEESLHAQRTLKLPVHVLPNAIPDRVATGRLVADREEIRKSLGVTSEDTVILSASRLSPAKNLAYGIEVMRRVIEDDTQVHWLIAGSGTEEELLKELANRYGLQNVRFLGYRDDVSRLLSAADFLLMPSLYEGMPLAPVEAMAKGVVPVLTPFAGHDSLIENGVSGVVIPFDQSDQSAERFKIILNDQASQLRMRETALEAVTKNFVASQMAKNLEGLYREILRKR